MPARSDKKPSRPFSRTAISSFISGLFAVPLLGTMTACLSIVLGHTAIWKCENENLRGKRLAISGLTLGYLSLFTTFILVIGGIVAGIGKGEEIKGFVDDLFFEKRVEESITSAARLFLACETYASKNNEQYPTSWNQLAGRYLTRNELNQLLQSSHPGGPAVSFNLIPHERPPLPVVLGTTVVIQETAPPNVKQVVVVYADGNTRLIDNPNVQSTAPEGI